MKSYAWQRSQLTARLRIQIVGAGLCLLSRRRASEDSLPSNAVWAASGYGVQGKSLLPRLADLPTVGGRQNVRVFAWYGLQGGAHVVDGFVTIRKALIRTAMT